MMSIGTAAPVAGYPVTAPAIVSDWTKFIFCTDLHGDEGHSPTVAAVLNFSDIWKPDLRVFGGDCWDLRPLRKGASEDEKADDMAMDFAAGMEFMERYRPHFFLRGNHDERLWDLAQGKAGPVRMFAGKCCGEIEDTFKKMGTRMLPYHKRDGILKVGGLAMLHGYAAGINAARKHALTYGSCLFGHVHAFDEATVERGEKTKAYAVGAMCNVDMPYNRAQLGSLRHENGFAYGVINERTGAFKVWTAERIGDRFLIAAGFEEL